MPTWGEILIEFKTPPNNPDLIRRKYLSALANHTGRDTILYLTKWTDPAGVNPDVISITEEDIQGFMEVVHGLRNTSLDLIIHSPGGSPAATEAIVKYLRKKFTDIRIIVPQGAMSAGTMLACAGNRIVMGKHSFLGPIDPQFILPHTQGMHRMVPAQAILDQFDLAKKECKDSQNLGPWLPILTQYGPGLLIECKNAIALSKVLVQDWLKKYMLHGTPRASYKAALIAKHLAAHQAHKSHSRHLDREDCRGLGLTIDNLEADETLQDLVLSVFHASTITCNVSPVAKIIENHKGKAFIKLSGRMMPLLPQQPPQPPQIPQALS
jgi:hypothetical protein